MTFFAWLQTTAIATAVGGWTLLTGSLSAVHLLGFTVVTGGALISNLRLAGVLLAEHSAVDVSRPASRGIALGLMISVATRVLLFAPKAATVSANLTFQIKMLLVGAAAVFHFIVHRAATRRPVMAAGTLRAFGATGLALWLGVAMAGSAFILLE